MGVKGFVNNRHRICFQLRYPEAEYSGPALLYPVRFPYKWFQNVRSGSRARRRPMKKRSIHTSM